MNPKEHRFEIESRAADDHDLAVDDASLRQHCGQRLDELREVAIHRLGVTALQKDLVPIAKHDRAEAVPLRLEQPPLSIGKSCCRGGKHGLEGRIEWKTHRLHRKGIFT